MNFACARVRVANNAASRRGAGGDLDAHKAATAHPGSEKTRGIWNPEKTRTRKNPGSMVEKIRAAGTQICHDVNFEQP